MTAPSTASPQPNPFPPRDEPGSPREFTGSQLTREGLVIVIRDKPGVAVFTYRQRK
jgi:hypothetical protein